VTGDDGVEVLDVLALIERRRVGFFYRMSKRSEQLCNAVNCSNTVRMQRSAALGRAPHRADAQPSRIGANFLCEWSLLRRSGIGIAGHPAGNDIKHSRGVPHRTADHSFDRQAVPCITGVGAERNPAARRFEPN